MKAFSQRLSQALIERQDVIKGGRGLICRFATHFGMHYTTAQRILAGKNLPSLFSFREISETLQVSPAWLLGLSDIGLADKDRVEVKCYSPDNPWHMRRSASLPIEVLGEEPGEYVFAQASGRFAEVKTVIARVFPSPVDGQICLVRLPEDGFSSIMRVQVIQKRLFLHFGDGRDSMQFKIKDVLFGDINAVTSPVVVGPLVGSLDLSCEF